jgi:hypothetical protein
MGQVVTVTSPGAQKKSNPEGLPFKIFFDGKLLA